MPSLSPALNLPVPRNQTALMQHLQLLVGRENHRYWCGGVISTDKLKDFVVKMSKRYPITRNTRGRVYDRTRGLAVVHFVVFPMDNEQVAWWLLSSEGRGGLVDPLSPDAHVSHDAMAADYHIEFGDYVLLYATKRMYMREEGEGLKKRRSVETSTWTWKIKGSVFSELKVGLERECAKLSYGDDGGAGRRPWGVRGLLARQRCRPLFSGVRNQVIELHRYARDKWEARRPAWCRQHPEYAKRYGDRAGALLPLNVVMQAHLPTMGRIKVYGDSVATVANLCSAPGDKEVSHIEQ